MKTKSAYKVILGTILIALLGGLTFCQFGEGDAMDSYRGTGDPLFVAVASDGFSYVSTDGKSWTKGGSTGGTGCYSVTYGDGKFIAVENNGDSIFISYDGINWIEYEPTDTGIDSGEQFTTIRYGNEMFIIGERDGDVYYSINGFQWNKAGGEIPAGTEVGNISFGNSQFFLTTAAGGDSPIYTSNDGVHWCDSNNPYAINIDDDYGVCYGNTLFVVYGRTEDNGTSYEMIRVSQDGTNWSDNLGEQIDGSFAGIAYGQGIFVAVGTVSSVVYVYISTNGFIWDGPIKLQDTFGPYSIKYSNGLFIIYGSNGMIIYSEDGSNWSGNVGPGGTIIIYDIAVRP